MINSYSMSNINIGLFAIIFAIQFILFLSAYCNLSQKGYVISKWSNINIKIQM